MKDGATLKWTSAEENNVKVNLLEDNFSVAIDGSGYVVKLPFSMSA